MSTDEFRQRIEKDFQKGFRGRRKIFQKSLDATLVSAEAKSYGSCSQQKQILGGEKANNERSSMAYLSQSSSSPTSTCSKQCVNLLQSREFESFVLASTQKLLRGLSTFLDSFPIIFCRKWTLQVLWPVL